MKRVKGESASANRRLKHSPAGAFNLKIPRSPNVDDRGFSAWLSPPCSSDEFYLHSTRSGQRSTQVGPYINRSLFTETRHSQQRVVFSLTASQSVKTGSLRCTKAGSFDKTKYLHWNGHLMALRTRIRRGRTVDRGQCVSGAVLWFKITQRRHKNEA